MVAYGVDAVRAFLEAVVGERLSLGMRRVNHWRRNVDRPRIRTSALPKNAPMSDWPSLWRGCLFATFADRMLPRVTSPRIPNAR